KNETNNRKRVKINNTNNETNNKIHIDTITANNNTNYNNINYNNINTNNTNYNNINTNNTNYNNINNNSVNYNNINNNSVNYNNINNNSVNYNNNTNYNNINYNNNTNYNNIIKEHEKRENIRCGTKRVKLNTFNISNNNINTASHLRYAGKEYCISNISCYNVYNMDNRSDFMFNRVYNNKDYSGSKPNWDVYNIRSVIT
ncbi:hypothetical protein CDIK_2173, partial [Cucumispora dikerogammari]